MIYQAITDNSLLIEGAYDDCNDAIERAVRTSNGKSYFLALRCREIGGQWRTVYARSKNAIADNLWRTCGMQTASGEDANAAASSAAWAESVCKGAR